MMVKLIYHKNFKKLVNFVQKDYYFLISNHKYDVRSNGYQPLLGKSFVLVYVIPSRALPCCFRVINTRNFHKKHRTRAT